MHVGLIVPETVVRIEPQFFWNIDHVRCLSVIEGVARTVMQYSGCRNLVRLV